MRVVSAGQVAANALLNLFGSVTVFILGVVSSIIVTRCLGPHMYGVFSLLTWFAGVLGILVGFGMPTAMNKYVAELSGRGDKQARSVLASFALLLVVGFGVAAVLLTSIFSDSLGVLLSLPAGFSHYIPVAGVIAALTASAGAFSAILIGLQHFKQLALGGVVIAATTLVSTTALLGTGRGLSGALIGSAAGYFLGVIVYSRFTRRGGIKFGLKHGLSSETLKRFMRYAVVAAGIPLINIVVWERSEVFFLSKYGGADQVGFYSLAFGLSSAVMTTGLGALAAVLTPLVAFQNGTGESSQIAVTFQRSTRYLTMLVLPVCAIGVALASLLIDLFYGPDFAEAAPVLRIVLMGASAGTIGRAASAIVYGTERHSFILKTGVPLALFNIVLDLLLIPKLGATGAGWANTVTQFVSICVGSAYVCAALRVRYPALAVVRIAVASAGAGIATAAIASWIPGVVGMLVAGLGGLLAYTTLLALIGELAAKDVFLVVALLKSLLNSTRMRPQRDGYEFRG